MIRETASPPGGADRDSADFNAFFAATWSKLVGQLFAMTGDLGEAEDALQEAYVRAWQRWSRLRDYDNPEAWVRSVACRLCTNSWWKTKNRITAHRRALRREHAPELGPDLVALIRALRDVPEKQRRALVLHYVADLTVEQIATETGAAVGTVKSWLARGRKALAPLVSESDDGGIGRARAGISTTNQANHSSSKDYGYV